MEEQEKNNNTVIGKEKFISVVVPTYNGLRYLKICLKHLLNQDYNDYEILVVNDGSTDDTYTFLESLNEPKIKIFHQRHLGPSRARNLGVHNAKGDIVAFTDDDCAPRNDWLKAVNKSFDCLYCWGVIGKTVYIDDKHKPSFPQKVVENKEATMPMTCNIAYRKKILQVINYFDPEFDKYEDKDVALKVMRFGSIHSEKEMVVYHQLKFWKPKDLLASAKNWSIWVNLIKRHGSFLYLDRKNPPPLFANVVLFPMDYLYLIFLPILLPILLIRYRFIKKQRDYKLFFLRWVSHLFLKRYYIWKAAWQQKVLVI